MKVFNHTLLIALLWASNDTTTCHALNVLVVGGSGRVGGSTVRWLKTLSDRQQQNQHLQQETKKSASPVSITVGGRKKESYEIAKRKKVVPSEVNFLSMDIDGEEGLLAQTLKQWKQSCSTTSSSDNNDCLVVHTAGPFQGRRNPILLSTCIDLSIPYVDVCDEWDLAELSKLELDSKAKENKVPTIISCGIWPGVSALMAKEGVELLKSRYSSQSGDGSSAKQNVEIESIDYSFFTAGTGNAGPTIVSATFLLLATPVITFFNGKRKDIEPWTELKEVDFGKGIGNKLVWLLDNPDVPTTALYLDAENNNNGGNDSRSLIPNVSSRFGTAPLVWNYLFGGMKILPRSLLYNRNAMQAFALFSEPIIRFVDKLVGATNAMRVDITGRVLGGKENDGEKKVVTLRMAHDDLEQCVGLATAAFAMEVANSMFYSEKGDDEATVTVPPGVWFPVELGKRARKNILRVVKEDAFVYELGRDDA